MTATPWIHHRRSVRLAGYDYTAPGAYFVTVCSHQRRCVFGRVVQDGMALNRYGCIVRDEWLRLAVRPNVELDEFVVMPNHLHGIVILTEKTVVAHVNSPLSVRKFGVADAGSLSVIVSQFKANVTKTVHARRGEWHPNAAPVRVWQGRFYDHIIRDEDELNRVRRYTVENP
jgi:putative transposase